MQDYKMTVESFTVSYSFDTHSNGAKHSHFVSAAVRTDPPVAMEDFLIVQIDAALRVTAAALQDAVSRMTMTAQEAQARMQEVKENFESVRSKLIEKRERTTSESK